MNTAYETYGGRKAAKIAHDPAKHYPNKDEAQLLRQLMSKTGMTEEQVRADVKYRRMLAEARKSGQNRKRSEQQKFYQNMIKKACKQTGLAPQHPETIKVLEKTLEIEQSRIHLGFRNWWMRSNTLSVKKVLEYYAKK